MTSVGTVARKPAAAAGRTGGARSVRDVARLRLGTGLALLAVALVGVLGGDWDIQWHAMIGRDRTFTPPHDMILLAIGLAGIVALASILIETRWAARQPEPRRYSSDFAGMFHSGLGTYLVGFGAVCSAVAFPLDTYWHALYGVDVSLWAPFHTMIYMGGVLSTFGMLYLLLSAAHLAGRDAPTTATLSYAAAAAALGLLLSKLCTFLTPALTGHALRLPFATLSLYPALLALAAVFVCVLAVRLLPWPGAATTMVAAFLLLWLLVGAFVPPMMTLLVHAEHEVYLARAARIGSNLVPLLGQTPALLLLSLSLDGVVWLGRRRRWTSARLKLWGGIAATVSMALVAALTLLWMRAILAAAPAAATAAVGAASAHAGLSLALMLLLVVPGVLLGGWLGLAVSAASQTLRR